MRTPVGRRVTVGRDDERDAQTGATPLGAVTGSEGIAGVVLAAGLGTRLLPLTDVRPKALCPIGNVPLVDLALARVGSVAGAVAVNVHHHPDLMVDHLTRHHPRVHVSQEHGEALGTAGALGQLREWIDGRPVLLQNADAWMEGVDLEAFVGGWDGERLRFLTVLAVGGSGDFGDRRYAGLALLPWRDVAPLRPEPTGLYEVSWRQAEQDGRIDLVGHEGRWFDTGTPATYLAANLATSRGASVVAPDAVVAEGAVVERSVVWPGARVEPGERLFEQIRAPGPMTVDAAWPPA